MESLKSPVVVANIDDTNEQSFQGKYQKSIVIDRYDRKIGIIGVIIETVDVSEESYLIRLHMEMFSIVFAMNLILNIIKITNFSNSQTPEIFNFKMKVRRYEEKPLYCKDKVLTL